MAASGSRFRMKVLGVADPNADEEIELMIPEKRGFRNHWRTLLRCLLLACLLASFLSVSFIIFQEWYYLGHQLQRPKMMSPEQHQNICSTAYRFDCFPGDGSSEEECGKRGCCWNPNVSHPGEPYCFFASGATHYDWDPPVHTVFGMEAIATMTKSSPYPRDVKKIQVRVYFQSQSTVRIKIFDYMNKRFEVPLEYKTTSKKASDPNYELKFTREGFQVHRIGEETPLFDMRVAPLIFSDQFLEISSSLPSEYVYGLGETEDSLRRNMNWSRTVLWAHDTIPGAERNLYGSHPFYLAMEKSGSAHGVFLANSNAMEIILQPGPAVTFRTTGGILDLRIFVGPSPAAVIREYTDTIGKPFLPPYWSLGFHLCRFNYGTLNHTEEILGKNLEAGIPVDVQWNDLDYMKNRNDFSFDPVKFKGLPEFVKKLHQRGMHYIPLVDPGVRNGTYRPYDLGTEMDVFIKDPVSGKPFVGKVWNPVATVWPDFSHPNVTQYWTSLFDDFHNEVEYDGAWIDMNEPSNFWDGTEDGRCYPSLENSTLDYPPYTPHVDGGKLSYKTICPSAVQFGGRHYDLHNLYGTLETIATSKALGDIRAERQFIISRSTFPGQGHYGGHWTGDVVSSFDHMRKSIPQILNFGLYGIPMVGADICGFNGNTTKDLCKRWQQLGAFYPFSRNHNTDDGIPQDPASLGEEVVAAARETLLLRYTILPYIYSLFFHAHLTGEPVARPLFYEFPGDVNTFLLDTSFMLGDAVLVVPVLEENFSGEQLKTYLPKGWWYPHYQPETIIESLGEMTDVVVPARNHSIPILYREGTILLTQKPENNTFHSRKNPFNLKVFLTEKGTASGTFYWDDGVTPSQEVVGVYNHYSIEVTGHTLTIKSEKTGYSGVDLALTQIQIRGVMSSVSGVIINNVPWDNFTMSLKSRTLTIDAKNKLSFTEGLTLTWAL